MSPSSTISVQPAAFAHAGHDYDGARIIVGQAITDLAGALDANWGCGGTDDAGAKWCRQYDPAAYAAIGQASTMVDCLAKLNDLLQVNSVNHSNADAGSAHDPKPAEQRRPPPPSPHFDAPKFRGAYGGATDAPFWWGVISRWIQGHFWPNADDNKLDTVAAAWHTAADALRSVTKAAAPARDTIESQVSPEIPQILAQVDLVVNGVNATADWFDKLGSACSDYAAAVVDAHRKMFREAAEFIAMFTAVEGIGALIGGIGMIGGGAIMGARGAAVATRIAGFSAELATDAAVAVAPAAGAAAAVGSGILKSVQPLLEAQPNTFYANTRPGGQLQVPESERIRVYSGDAKPDFDGEQLAQDIRGKLTKSGWQRDDDTNVAVAQADVDGQYYSPDQLSSVSGKRDLPGMLAKPTDPGFDLPIQPNGRIARNTDGEYKILEYLRTRLTPNSTGTVDLYTENEPCSASCQDVISQFQRMFPKVKLNVTYTNPE